MSEQQPEAAASSDNGNRNKMGLMGATSYIIGNIVGAGIFIAPTAILQNTGTVGLSLCVWTLSALISVMGSFCYVELGTSIRISGADFAYLCYVKWYSVAFAFMCAGCALNYPATLAIQSQTFAEYVIKGFKLELADPTHEYYAKKLIGFSLLWLLMFLNFFSLKTLVSRFQIVATLAKILSTAIVICTGFYFLIFKGWTANLEAPFQGTEFDAGNVALAFFGGLFAYDGWDILNFGAEEIEKPRRTMPLAIIVGMIIVAIIYIATNISYFVVLTADQVKDSNAVASSFAAQSMGNFQYAVPFLICILLIGSLNSSLFSASRYLQAAAKQGHLPSFISCANDVNDSPRAAIFMNIVLSLGLSFAGDLDTLISYVGFAQWSQRALTMLALLWIRFRHIPVHPDAIRTPIILPITFFIICSSLVIVTVIEDIKVAGVGLCVIFAGFLIYFLFLWERSLPSTRIYQKASYLLNNATTTFTQIVFNTMPTRAPAEESFLIQDHLTTTSEKNNDMITSKDHQQRKKTNPINRIFRHRRANVADVKAPPPNYSETAVEDDRK
ncbi:unnamed protein product [Anisakis simplex]|uniref:Solute carrier family 7 member 13 (inferred by orthology to a human protein) n=1 Tax=Anisakis simplex TaxID=6269 RepID=A0A0M3JTU0_ANISI|nr:unnamed protein product [Anisakis simplex]